MTYIFPSQADPKEWKIRWLPNPGVEYDWTGPSALTNSAILAQRLM